MPETGADTKSLLSIVEAVTDGIVVCSPAKGAVKLAKEVIEIVEKVRKNQKDCTELARYTCKMMIAIVDVLKGKKDDHIPSQLKFCLQSVASQTVVITLLEVKSGLESLKLRKDFNFKSAIKAIYRRQYVAEQISSYIARIDVAVRSDIRIVVGDIHSVVRNVHSMVGDVHLAVKGVHSEVAGIREDLRSFWIADLHIASTSALPGSSLNISSAVPAPPAQFYGRDDVVGDAVNKLTNDTKHHVALLGTGGVGETSVALSVLDNAAVKS
ncbi:hypothetical protein PUNSTDRAFT_139064 [Punctularia strigosozonata HHB-11173 SS5]|uniref:NB-ARC domain-containing protein n=1 Tax=Punctularia strigosozonata (strain HHB-11173) TaxID=741275 RepID=R7S2L2_PUNST|nr:uncharacterized protein PUNSTDRAFT_139064 [Punctularia strigosozonata HHB-11173 SS5]EIN04022.1 hypothetical protein PUNSTDRAFT_139064 [Punctularia strigosozonata HHB-11173 SS5]